VFGTLRRFGVSFAPQVERMLIEWTPEYNAVHRAAARALERGWPVWTPNIDIAIERQYRELAGRPARRGAVRVRPARDRARAPSRTVWP
jgi:hypothetical protein